MCVMILCRKTPSTSSMNMLTRSSEPTSSHDPNGPNVRTWRQRHETLKRYRDTKVQVFIKYGGETTCSTILFLSVTCSDLHRHYEVKVQL